MPQSRRKFNPQLNAEARVQTVLETDKPSTSPRAARDLQLNKGTLGN